jgi:hypothetical protein
MNLFYIYFIFKLATISCHKIPMCEIELGEQRKGEMKNLAPSSS